MAFLNIAPTGTVLPFAGSTAPEGWAICNGAAINRTNYAALFAVVGTTYGTGDGSITFNLPDMQGVFPRGAGTNGTANYGGATGHTPAGGSPANKGRQRTAPNSLANGPSSVTSNTSSVSGSVGGSDGAHAHRTGTLVGGSATNFHTWTAASTASGATYGFGYGDHAVSATSSGHGHGISLTAAAQGGTAAAQTISGDTETTPAFLALNYIIKL